MEFRRVLFRSLPGARNGSAPSSARTRRKCWALWALMLTSLPGCAPMAWFEGQLMQKANGQRLYIQEVSVRDGFQIESRFVPTEQKIDLINGLSRTGLAKRSEEHTSELQSLMRNSYAVFCLKKKKQHS